MKRDGPTPEQIQAGETYERIVGDLYEVHGWAVDRRGWRKQERDGGIDLICEKKPRRVLIQCKCWTGDWGLAKDLEKFASDVADWRNRLGHVPEQQRFPFGEDYEYILIFAVTITATAEAGAVA